MFSKFGLLILVLVTLACAKPNYQEELPAPPKVQSDSALQTDLIWEQLPTTNQTGSFLLYFTGAVDQKSQILADDVIKVVLWMPAMNHGSSPVTVTKVTDNVYKASRVYFMMPGQWEIRIQILRGDQVVHQITKYFTL